MDDKIAKLHNLNEMFKSMLLDPVPNVIINSSSDYFTSCEYLLIVDMDNMEIDTIKNSGDPKGEALARKIADNNCEAVITGRLTPEAFDIIADGNITRYDECGYSAEEALVLMGTVCTEAYQKC